MLARAFLKYPEIAKDLVKRAGRYNKCVRKLEKLEKQGKVIVIRPESTQGFSRLERDNTKIQTLYDEGYEKELPYLTRLKTF